MVGSSKTNKHNPQDDLEMAYKVLTDPKSREEYDLYLRSNKKDTNYWNWQAGDSDQKGDQDEEVRDEDEH